MLRGTFRVCNLDVDENGVGKAKSSFYTFTQFLTILAENDDNIDLSELLPLASALETAVISISGVIRTAVVDTFKGLETNISETVNKIFVDTLMSSSCPLCIVTESEENVIQGFERGSHVIYISSLDNEENIRSGYACGMTFSFLRYPAELRKKGKLLSDKDVLFAGEEMELTGYIVFGCSTELVVAIRNLGLHQFTFDPNIGLFTLTGENLELPRKAQFYFEEGSISVNWHDVISKFLDAKVSLTDIELTYYNPGGYVSLLHAVVKTGGICLLDEGKVPLLYCAVPMAFIIKEGKGQSITGRTCSDVLQIKPTGLHMKTGICYGSFIDIDLLKHIHLDLVEFIK